ncbi:uncharacterized protein [Cardiocondyla obscurior]
MILGAAVGAQLTLLPYAYLGNTLPVYHQSQDTRAGVHAYSYAGGPSAKEEVRGLDGVTRGSYSYVDAHGILQSVFYVADEDGFRVAATNLPTDNSLPHETNEVLLAKYAYSHEHAKATVEREEGHTSRRKRSPEAPADQDQRQTENPSSQGDQADRDSAANATPKSSHEVLKSEEKSSQDRANRGTADPAVVAPVYGLLGSVLIPRSGATASHQSRVDVHNTIRLKAAQAIKPAGVPSEPVYEAVILPSQIPLATSHQNRVQVHDNLRAEVPEEFVNAQTIEFQSQTPEGTTIDLEPFISILPNYNEHRIQLHKNLGLEGTNRKDAVKIDAAQLVIPAVAKKSVPVVVEEAVPVATKEAIPIIAKEAIPVVAKEAIPILAKEAIPVVAKEAIPVVAKEIVPVISKEALPVVTAISNQSKIQIHRNTKLDVTVPSEPTVYLATSYVRPITSWPIFAPSFTQFSQYRH